MENHDTSAATTLLDEEAMLQAQADGQGISWGLYKIWFGSILKSPASLLYNPEP